MARWILFLVVAFGTTGGLFLLRQQLVVASLAEVSQVYGMLGILAGLVAVVAWTLDIDLRYSRGFLKVLDRRQVIAPLQKFAREMEGLFDKEITLERKKRSLGENFGREDGDRLASVRSEIHQGKRAFWMLHRQVVRAKIENLPTTIKGYAEWDPDKENRQQSEAAETKVGQEQPEGGLQY